MESEAWGGGKAIVIGILTVTSFGIFSLHYLMRVDAMSFLSTLKARFFARNFTTSVLLTDVFAGYLKSFLYLWILIIVLLVWSITRNKQIVTHKGRIMFVLIFPVIENIIMKQHAQVYTYDRMKLIFFLSFLVCELTENIICDNRGVMRMTETCLMSLTVCICALNLRSYRADQSYVWGTDYRHNNEILADFISDNYEDSVLSTEAAVRGYISLLFGRGVHEETNTDGCIQLAINDGKRYAVEIWVRPVAYDLVPIDHVDVYDLNSGDANSYHIQDGDVVMEKLSTAE